MTTIKTRPLVEITQEAFRVLYKEIGIVNTVRFVNQFTTGYGDYTQERERLFADLTLDDMITDMMSSRSEKPVRRQSASKGK